MLSIESYEDFHSACSEVLRYLHERLGFALWMITRVEEKDWIVLNSEDNGYQVHPGDVFCWADSFCSRMVQGHGPRIAPRSQLIPAYASAPIAEQVPIGAYIGVPMNQADGKLFGTLCAIDPHPQPEAIANELPMIEMFARMLATILESELKAHAEGRRAERAHADSTRDVLTGLFNRRGWNHLLVHEEQRCRKYGHPASVLSVDLDNLKTTNDVHGHAAGDELLRRTATTLRVAARDCDVVARVGGDEYAILAVECGKSIAEKLAQRIQRILEAAGVRASIGYAVRQPQASLKQTWDQADRQMYVHKRQRKLSQALVLGDEGPPTLPICQVN